MERVNLETFAGGALQEKFDNEKEYLWQELKELPQYIVIS